jgi:hypothetical protein
MTAPSIAKRCFALCFGLFEAWLAQRGNYTRLNFVATFFVSRGNKKATAAITGRKICAVTQNRRLAQRILSLKKSGDHQER